MFVEDFLKWCFLFSLALFCDCEGSVKLTGRNKYGRLQAPSLAPSDVPVPPDNWFTQILDHSRPTDTTTWQQRYRVVTDYYKEGGPVFLKLEGEYEATDFGGAWENYAKKYNAMMFQLEHRYYGQSRPTSDLSVENLRYLTSEQALADVAYFIVGMNRQHKLPRDTKWVAFGGSYAGNLAAWVRYKYPHLVHAAVASSGPVLAQVDFSEFMDVVRDSLGTHSSRCNEAVEDANKEISNLLKTEVGRHTITDKFRLCSLIEDNNRNDVKRLLEVLSRNIAAFVQYDKKGNITIDTLCDIMVNQSLGTPVIRYAAVNSLFLKSPCLDYKYENYIEIMKNTSYNSKEASDRAWIYQTCTEFGVYQTSENNTALFGYSLPIDYFTQKCTDMYGKEFTKELVYQGVERSNILHGGLDIKATRVVYVHGSLDPWYILGITKTRIPESPAFFINGTSHCFNMNSPTETDPPALKAAREEIQTLIGKWLKEP